jgi:uncharacterized protein
MLIGLGLAQRRPRQGFWYWVEHTPIVVGSGSSGWSGGSSSGGGFSGGGFSGGGGSFGGGGSSGSW